MRRLFTFWRIVALLALALAAWAIFSQSGPSGPYIARHEITGIIFDDADRAAVLRGIADDPLAQALVLRIDSPGGTVAGSEALFHAIREVAERKPVVAVMGEVAASGGYIAAIGADRIVARGNTLTGSIGVVKQEVDVRELMDSLGVEISERRSDVFKAMPSPFSPTPAIVDEWEDVLIADAYQWFRGLVAERRGLSEAQLDQVADGRVFSGRQALERGLIDEIGGEELALGWFAAQGVDASLPILTLELPQDEQSWLLDALGLSALDARLLRRFGMEGLTPGPRLYSILN